MALMFPHITRENQIVTNQNAAWMFKGLEQTKLSETLVLVGGGAAGLELDRYDLRIWYTP